MDPFLHFNPYPNTHDDKTMPNKKNAEIANIEYPFAIKREYEFLDTDIDTDIDAGINTDTSTECKVDTEIDVDTDTATNSDFDIDTEVDTEIDDNHDNKRKESPSTTVKRLKKDSSLICSSHHFKSITGMMFYPGMQRLVVTVEEEIKANRALEISSSVCI